MRSTIAKEIEGEIKELTTEKKNIKGLNPMCVNCINPDCFGTTNKLWSGCIYRQTEKKEA